MTFTKATGKTTISTGDLLLLLSSVEKKKPNLKHKIWAKIAKARKVLRKSNGTAHLSEKLLGELRAYA